MYGKFISCEQLLKFISRLKDVNGRVEFHMPGCDFTPHFKSAEELLKILGKIRDDRVHSGFPESTTTKPLPLESIQLEVRVFKLEETHFSKHLAFSLHGINFEMHADPSYVLEIKLSGIWEVNDFFSLF